MEDRIEQMIQDKGLTAPRVTPQMIDDVIVEKYFFTAMDGFNGVHVNDPTDYEKEHDSALQSLKYLTFCVLVLRNGFTVTGESACASPENFNAEVGREIAFENARNKVWQLEGYALKERLFNEQ